MCGYKSGAAAVVNEFGWRCGECFAGMFITDSLFAGCPCRSRRRLNAFIMKLSDSSTRKFNLKLKTKSLYFCR